MLRDCCNSVALPRSKVKDDEKKNAKGNDSSVHRSGDDSPVYQELIDAADICE